MEVLIKNGEYRNIPIINTKFKLHDGPKNGKKGLFVSVHNDKFPEAAEKIRVKISSLNDIEMDGMTPTLDTGEEAEELPAAPKIEETDEEAMDRIANRFEILDNMSAACINGKIRGMIVSGPPGVGKSFGVEQQLEKSSIIEKLAGKPLRYETVKGAMTALGLYAKLYEYSDPKNVLVFDDCDSIFTDELSLNILKAALDSSKVRRICWNSDSRLLREEGIPNTFNFKGSAIFITNLKFANVRSKKLQDHLEALESRCHFLDLTIDTDRDKMLRIRQVDRDSEGGLFNGYKFRNGEDKMVLTYMEENHHKLREMSIRMALKLADLILVDPVNWKNLAENTCMRRR